MGLATPLRREANPSGENRSARRLPRLLSIKEMEKNAGQPVPIMPLTDSLQPLKDHFNANRGKLRFMAVISPRLKDYPADV
jgi:hypothetical protein